MFVFSHCTVTSSDLKHAVLMICEDLSVNYIFQTMKYFFFFLDLNDLLAKNSCHHMGKEQ